MRSILVLIACVLGCVACDDTGYSRQSHMQNRGAKSVQQQLPDNSPLLRDDGRLGGLGGGESTQPKPAEQTEQKGAQQTEVQQKKGTQEKPSKDKGQPTTKESTNKSKQDVARAIAEMQALFKKEKIDVDLGKKTVSIPVKVNRLTDFLEYLLIHRHGKTHESLLVTYTKPSVLNAAFKLVGFEDGKNFTLVDKDPMPSEEELRKGAEPYDEIAPKGMPLYMTVKMVLKNGKTFEVPVDDLVLDLTTQQAVRGMSWVFLGGRMAVFVRGEPPVYAADMEGNLISVCYRRPKNHLATGHHPRARDDHNWSVNWADSTKNAGLGQYACPPVGTELTLTFHRIKPKLLVERVKRLPPPPKKQPPSKPPGKQPAGKQPAGKGPAGKGPAGKAATTTSRQTARCCCTLRS